MSDPASHACHRRQFCRRRRRLQGGSHKRSGNTMADQQPSSSRQRAHHHLCGCSMAGRRRQDAAPHTARADGDECRAWAAAAGRTVREVQHSCACRFSTHAAADSIQTTPDCRSYGEPRFRDPNLPDTRLTAAGRQQAAAARAAAAQLAPAPELVVSSPLTRALDTAAIMFGDHRWGNLKAAWRSMHGLGAPDAQAVCHWPPLCPQGHPIPPPRHRSCRRSAPRLVQPLAAERLYLSSDVGRVREELEAEFSPPSFDFAALVPGQPWWHDEAQGTDGQLEAAAGAESLDLIDAREPPGGWTGLAWLGAGGSEPGVGAAATRNCAKVTGCRRVALPSRAGAFLRRAERLRQWLADRPECCVALVTHWGLLHALTGAVSGWAWARDGSMRLGCAGWRTLPLMPAYDLCPPPWHLAGVEFENCEIRTVRLSQLRARPHLVKAAFEAAV